MQTHNDDEFRKLIKQKFNEIPVTDDGKDVWAALEKRLDEKKSKKGVLWFNRKTLLVIFLLLMITGFSIFFITNLTEVNTGSKPVTENKNDLSTEKNATASPAKDKNTTDVSKEKITEPVVVGHSHTTASSNAGKVQKKTNTTEGGNIGKSGDKPILNEKPDKQTGLPVKESGDKKDDSPVPQKEIVLNEDPKDTGSTEAVVDPIVSDKNIHANDTDIQATISPVSQKEKKKRNPHICFEIGLGFNDFSFNNFRQTQNPIAPSYSVFVDLPYGKFLSFSPSLSFINSASAIQVNYIDSPSVHRYNINTLKFIQLGLNNRLRLNKHISLNLGFGYARLFKFYSISKEELNINSSGQNDRIAASKIARSNEVNPFIKKFDLNINYGLEFKFNRYCIALRGLNGFYDITPNTSQKYVIDNFSVNVAYWIKYKK